MWRTGFDDDFKLAHPNEGSTRQHVWVIGYQSDCGGAQIRGFYGGEAVIMGFMLMGCPYQSMLWGRAVFLGRFMGG